MSQGMSSIQCAYYQRTEEGNVVICPYCRELHTYNVTGMNKCYEGLGEFSVIEPFLPWQYREVEEVKSRLEDEG